jgi:hypothetical protein
MRKAQRCRPQSIARRRAGKARRRLDRLSRRPTHFRGPLPTVEVRTDDTSLTAYAGLLPLLAFLSKRLGLMRRLRSVVGRVGRRRHHPVHLVLSAFVVASLGGLSSLAQLETLASDPLLVQQLRLSYWPVRKVFAQALAQVDDEARDALVDYVSELGLSMLRPDGPEGKSVVIDIDTTAIIDNGAGEGSLFGHCGKGRRRRRHHPLVASAGCCQAIVLARYRDGRNVTADELIAFFTDLLQRLRRKLGPDCTITVRSDAGIFGVRVAQFLEREGAHFVMALPLSVRVKERLPSAPFVRLDEEIETVRLPSREVGVAQDWQVALVRRVVHDKAAPPLGKKVTGLEGWRFQGIISDCAWEASDLWRFYNGRANCERVFRVGKQVLGLGHLVSRRFRANESAFVLRTLAFNADLLFQAEQAQAARQQGRKVLSVGLEWRQRYFYRSPGRLVRHSGQWVLHVSAHEVIARLWRFYAPAGIVCATMPEVSAR